MTGYLVVPSPTYTGAQFARARAYDRSEDAVAAMGEGMVVDDVGRLVAFHERHLAYLLATGHAVGDPSHPRPAPSPTGPDPADGPDVATLAGYVLRYTDAPGTHVTPGRFYDLLVQAMFQADPANRARLGAGFPTLASMVDAYKTTHDGVDRLRTAKTTGEWAR